jgi:CheY-like chemotaxis protein
MYPISNLNYFPGRNGYNPAIIFSSDNFPDEDGMKNQALYQAVHLKKEPLYILLADDDADDRELFGEAIEETGLNVKLDFAEDGKDLINMLSSLQNLPHMIFLDLNMPNKSGRECLDFIRNSEKLKHIPVIIYSTSSSTSDIDDTYSKGANLYVKKPTSYNELLEMAKNVLLLNWLNHPPGSSKTNFLFSLKKR